MKGILFLLTVAGAVGCSVFGSVRPEVARPFSSETAADAKPWERTAKAELDEYLAKVSQDGKVVVGGRDGIVFHVGDTDFAKKAGLGSETLKDEEWVIRSVGRDVVLNGGGTRGCLYAVSRFLEDFCDVRWWFDGDEDVPAAKPLSLPPLDRRGRPHFLCRDIYRMVASDPRLAIRGRLNGNGDSTIPAGLGGGFVYGPPYHTHTWDLYFPFAKHGKEHPEWYALRDGRREGGGTVAQMCLTCPGLVDEFVKAVEKSIEKGERDARAKGLPAPRIYDLSMNDNWGFCQCERCAAETEKYGHSGRQLRFVNAIAERVGARHPDLLFSLLAYYYSEPVPKGGVRAADNVVVKLCNTRQNMAAGIESPENRFMHDQTIAWSKYAKNLFVWEYAITFDAQTKGFPFPSEFHLVDKYRFYAKNGVKGFLVEHEDPDTSDMYELKFFLERKVLEDPEVDGNALIAEFMSRYYGAAGAKVLAARRYLERIRTERAAFITWFPTVAEFNFIRKADVARMKALFAEAEAAVRDDPRRLKRVLRARESIDRIEAVRKNDPVLHKPELGVASRPFYDFPVTREGGTWHLCSSDFTIVDDPEAYHSLAAKVVCTDRQKLGLPFSVGMYDKKGGKTVMGQSLERVTADGYQWYTLGQGVLPQAFYIYFSRQWTLQLQVGSPEMEGREFLVRAHMKFTGPDYGRGGTESAAYIDRVVFETVDDAK